VAHLARRGDLGQADAMRRLVLVADLSVDGFLGPDGAEYDNHELRLYRRRVLQKAGVLVREGDLDVDAITDLMAEGGHEELAPVVVVGAPALQRELSRLGLVDEYRVIVHPVVLGEGDRFFAAHERLHLVTSRFFATGSTAHAYVPERAYRDRPPPLPWAEGTDENDDDAEADEATQRPPPG
jgi:riboflavin biosynthesis pyrimidine reductase